MVRYDFSLIIEEKALFCPIFTRRDILPPLPLIDCSIPLMKLSHSPNDMILPPPPPSIIRDLEWSCIALH